MCTEEDKCDSTTQGDGRLTCELRVIDKKDGAGQIAVSTYRAGRSYTRKLIVGKAGWDKLVVADTHRLSSRIAGVEYEETGVRNLIKVPGGWRQTPGR